MASTCLQRVIFPKDLAAKSLYYRLEHPTSASLDPAPDGRVSITVPRGSKLVLDSYFNRFYANYWKEFTTVESLRLEIQVSGAGRVTLFRRANGDQCSEVATQGFRDCNHTVLVLDVPTTDFDIGAGVLHVELLAGDSDVYLQWDPLESTCRHASLSIL